MGLGTVIAGTLVALGITGALLVLGASIMVSVAQVDLDSLPSADTLDASVWAWGLGSVAVGSFWGGRTAAMTARALVRRDGALAGLVTGSLLALAGIAGGAGLAVLWPASRAAQLLWIVTAFEGVVLVVAVVGGIRGARSEARSIGLRSISLSRRGEEAGDSYETDFFGGAGLSGGYSRERDRLNG